MLLPWLIAAAFVGALLFLLRAYLRDARAGRSLSARRRLIWLLIICSALSVALTLYFRLDRRAGPPGSSALLFLLPMYAVVLATVLILLRGRRARPSPDVVTPAPRPRTEEAEMHHLKFISIGALMEDIGRGIGIANKELVTRSQTSIGALADKSADVSVSFELTSTATQ